MLPITFLSEIWNIPHFREPISDPIRLTNWLFCEPNKLYIWLIMYNWQQADWPHFSYQLQGIEDDLLAFAQNTGGIKGVLQTLPEEVQLSTIIQTMIAEAIKTSAIEGEKINPADVASSIKNKLGVAKKPANYKDPKAKGAGELMVEVYKTFAAPLSKEDLLGWHTMLLKHNTHINVGAWRKSKFAMQIISGTIGKEEIHFEAPPSSQVAGEMKKFIQWFNDTAPNGKHPLKQAPVRAAIAHLYFESIHPFEDGNGRIGRAIAEKALSQTTGSPVVISLSQTIEANKKAYYAALKKAQASNEITDWISWFVKMLLSAQQDTKKLIDFTIRKAKFFTKISNEINERQLKVINKMLEAGTNGFTGGMSAKKYMSITKTSKATATRDLQQLVELKAITLKGGGRSVHYELNL